MLDARILSRTLIVQTAFLGDVILTLPLLRNLKNKFPVAFLAVVATPEVAEALSGERCIDELILYDKRNRKRSKDVFSKICDDVRRQDFSCAILPHRSFRSAYLALRAGIKTRIGFHNSPGALFYTDRIRYHYALPEAQRNMRLLSRFEGSRDIETAWFSNAEVKRESGHAPRIVIAPGSQWKTKMWGAEHYGKLAAYCVEQGWNVDICGSGQDAVLCNTIFSSAASPLVENHCGKTGIPEFTELIRRATAVVANDSAPIHLANEVGTPVVAIFGPTVTEFGFAPRGIYDQVVQTEGLVCRPCSIHGDEQCPLGTHACMRDISPEMVISALRHVVNLRLGNANHIA